jgi:hypothetical protein
MRLKAKRVIESVNNSLSPSLKKRFNFYVGGGMLDVCGCGYVGCYDDLGAMLVSNLVTMVVWVVV